MKTVYSYQDSSFTTASVGNNKKQNDCVGFPSGNYAIDYNGFKVPLGGWHRESVFDRAKFVAATTPNSTNTTEKRP